MKSKKCTKCGKKRILSKFYKLSKSSDGLMHWCKKCKDYYDKNRVMTFGREKRIKNQKDYKLRLRKQLLDAYGHKCACCGETIDEFLELDHINGGGTQHRKLEKRDLYQVAKLEGYPKEKYRLLCSNCNHSLGLKGYCPHNLNFK